MSIEVKQLIIKSGVKNNDSVAQLSETGGPSQCELEQLKAEMLEHCRKLVIEQLKKSKER